MAVWRRKAIALFPELRREFARPDCTVYEVFSELLPRVLQAHRDGDEVTPAPIYGFAEWCFEQRRAKDLWNAAGVSFYEHLFDGGRDVWERVVPWLSQQVVGDVWGLGEARRPAADLLLIRGMFARRRRVELVLEARLTVRDV